MQPLLLTTTGQTPQGKTAQVAGVRDTEGDLVGFIDLVAALAGSDGTPDGATPKAKDVDATNEPGNSGESEQFEIQMASLVAFSKDTSRDDEGETDTTVIKGLGALALVPGDAPRDELPTDEVLPTLPPISAVGQPAAKLVPRPVPTEQGPESDAALDDSVTLTLDPTPLGGPVSDPEHGARASGAKVPMAMGDLPEVPRQALAGTVPIPAEAGQKEGGVREENSVWGQLSPTERLDKTTQVLVDPENPAQPALVSWPVVQSGDAPRRAEIPIFRSEREVAGAVPGQVSSLVAEIAPAKPVRISSEVGPKTSPPDPALAAPGLRVVSAPVRQEAADGEGVGEEEPRPTVALPGSTVRTLATQPGVQVAQLAVAAPTGPASPAAFSDEHLERGDPTSNGGLASIDEPGKATGSERTRADLPVARSVIQQIMHTVSRAQGDGVIEVRLQPEELGRVRLTMVAGEAGLSIQVTAERPETLDLIRRHIDAFESDLRDQGFAGMSFSFGAETQEESDRRERDAGPGDHVADRPGPDARVVAVIGPSATFDNGKLDIRI